MKNKFNDNKLAEELDCIVLTKASHSFPKGSLGTLISAYTRMDRPLYAQFTHPDGTSVVTPISLHDFRVLNTRNHNDLQLLLSPFNRFFTTTRA